MRCLLEECQHHTSAFLSSHPDAPQSPESENRPSSSSLTAALTSTPLEYAVAVGSS